MRIVRAVLLGLLVAAAFAGQVHAQTPPRSADEIPTDVLFVMDSSASMSRDDDRGRASDPAGLRRSAIRAFIALASPRMRVGLINLSEDYSGNRGLDKPTALETGVVMGLTDASPQGKEQLLAAVGGMLTTHEANLEDGFTYMSKALDLAQRVIAGSGAPQRYIVVLTDGDVTGEDPRAWWAQTRALQAEGVHVVVFRLGRREPPGLTNRELANLNQQLASGGGAARVVERPDDLLGFYLQTFVLLSPNSYVNALGQIGADEQPVLDVREWMDISEIYLLLPTGGGENKGPLVTRLTSDRLARDLAGEARVASASDPNLEIIALSRERLGSLNGLWRMALAAPIADAQVVIRSRVRLAVDPVVQPKGADQAVVVATAADGAVPIPDKRLLARGPVGDEPRPMLAGALGPDRYSIAIRPDRDGLVRLRVSSETPAPPNAPARRNLAPWLEKAFAIPTIDRIAAADLSLGAERLTSEKLLKAGQPLQVRVAAEGAGCQAQGVALKVDATYPEPPAGITGREVGLPAQPNGPAPGGGLIYGFVPQAPGTVSFVLDHAALRCPGVPQLVGVAAGGRRAGEQTFEVDVERLLKLEAASPRALEPVPAGTDTLEVTIRYDLASYRNERLLLSVQGLTGATTAPFVDLPAREGTERPRPRQGGVLARVKLAQGLPGGQKGTFTIVGSIAEEGGRSRELGRFPFAYEAAPGILSARLSRDPSINRDGITLTLGMDPSRLVMLPPATTQEFELSVDGLKGARIEPKIIRTPARRDIVEQIVFIQSEDICNQTGAVRLKLGMKPLPSPNGEIVVAGVPLELAVPLPRMQVSLAAPAQIGALRPGVPVSLSLQSTSLCPEALRLHITDPAHPDRFTDPGVSAPTARLGPGEGEVRTVDLLPVRAAPRGEGGTLRLEAVRTAGHPATLYPAPIVLGYYTPLWTEEFPDRARLVFGALVLAVTGLLALPRILFADPLVAHQAGDSSVVSGRKRFRWFLVSLATALVVALVVVYWAMARYLP